MEIIKVRGSGMYVHVPYCKSKCAYCDFYSVASGTPGAYLNALALEARCLSPEGSTDTVYIGGGTPTSLEAPLLSDLLRIISEAARVGPSGEFTVEANPGTLDQQKLDIMKQHGVTRVSLGVQSLIDRELRAIGRIHNADEAIRAARLIKDAGFALSLDLMYGLPSQSMRDWARTLNGAIELAPEHISAYELTPEEGTPIWDAIEDGLIEMPSEDLATDMFHLGREVLTGAGYGHYEVSNYALPGCECRHNQNYWRRGTFIGLGPGAHSFDGRHRWWNIEDVDAYVRRINEGIATVDECHELTPQDALREEVMLGLRTLEGLDIARFRNVHGLDLIAACTEMMHDGLMFEAEGRVALTPKALMLMNPVTVRLFVSLGL